MNNIAVRAAPKSTRAVTDRDSFVRLNPTKTSGQSRYHCSSTARLHRWRSSGGFPE